MSCPMCRETEWEGIRQSQAVLFFFVVIAVAGLLLLAPQVSAQRTSKSAGGRYDAQRPAAASGNRVHAARFESGSVAARRSRRQQDGQGKESPTKAAFRDLGQLGKLTFHATILSSSLGLFGVQTAAADEQPSPNAATSVRPTDVSKSARPSEAPPAAVGRPAAGLQALPLEPTDPMEHPLAPALRYATVRYDFIRRHVRDYTCVLVKRERIGGRLTGYQHLYTMVRSQHLQHGRAVKPFSVYVQYLAPARLEGRKVLYVAGQNDGKMLVRNGGGRFAYVKVKVRPNSEAAMQESRYPITELGIDIVVKRLIERGEEDIIADPMGTNTEVFYFKNAKVNNRPCLRIRIVHPERQKGLTFHVAELYIDNQLQVPLRIEGYDWPRDEGGEPRLSEEYTYSNLKLNVGLTDADFSPAKLD